jgi:magnesium-transporting ATPase (P-type)
MSTRTDLVFKGLYFLSWIIFIGLCIESGAFLFNFIFTLLKPVGAHNIYKGLDLSDLYEKEQTHYIGIMTLIVLVSTLKAFLFFQVIKAFTKLNIAKPFSNEIANLIKKMSEVAISIAITSYIGRQYTNWLTQKGLDLDKTGLYWEDAFAFFMMAAILYFIVHIFRKGIKLQIESDLTI